MTLATAALSPDAALVLDLLVTKIERRGWGEHKALTLGSDRFDAAVTTLILDDFAWRVDGVVVVTHAGYVAHTGREPGILTAEALGISDDGVTFED